MTLWLAAVTALLIAAAWVAVGAIPDEVDVEVAHTDFDAELAELLDEEGRL